ncbi:CaiB/BaiF CoA transferase family protein [Natrialba swarupiae]|uniref:CoA transferase n=1 Tax=Natrialba swarupiae TaxID=2448032 RepID=A0A5D5AL43_9EURY|nr:CaiB/BaiF CoA-transferase family protein [Natrialba swarupiae]TYT62588.1 CoA transferase [Natrialba swarupiae]
MHLDEYTVLDLTQLLPGAYTTQLLADLGATVLKVEPPDGDPLRSVPLVEPDDGVFDGLSRGKRSVTLDLKTDEGQEALHSIVTDVDVVIEGYRPGVASRLGADEETLRSIAPNLVYCSLSGFGQSGPYSDRPGHDLTFAGLSGLVDLSRRSTEQRPTPPPFSVSDIGGGLFAAFSIVTALLSRERTGDGSYIDVSMLDVLLSFSQSYAPSALAGTDPRPPEPFTGLYPCYDVYETADGRYVTLAAVEPQFWDRFCDLIDRPDLREKHCSPDPAVRDALREEVVDIFAARSQSAWLEAADEETPIAAVNTLEEALESDHARERELVVDGRIGFPAQTEPPVEPATDGPPALGEHTREVLAAAGYSEAEIDALVDAD